MDLQLVDLQLAGLHSWGLHSWGLQAVGQEQGWCLRMGHRGLRAQGQEGVQTHQGHQEELRLGRGLGQGTELGQWGSSRKGFSVDKG